MFLKLTMHMCHSESPINFHVYHTDDYNKPIVTPDNTTTNIYRTWLGRSVNISCKVMVKTSRCSFVT